MKMKLLVALGFATFLNVPTLASAQVIQNNTNSNLQQQQTGAQTTQTPQGATAPVQQNSGSQTLTQPQQESLQVFSSPAQSNPSVVVGASEGSAPADNSQDNSSGDTNYTIFALLIFAILAAYVVALTTKSGRSTLAAAINTQPAEAEQVATAKKAVRKPKKKKKKTTHR